MQLLNTLYVTTPDTYLRLDNDTLRVEVNRETRLRVPLHHLSAVVCFGHINLSAPLMHLLADRGIALVLLDDNGRFKARLEGAVSGNVLLRHARAGDATADDDEVPRLAFEPRQRLGTRRHQSLHGPPSCSSLPGFMMPAGSKACLTLRIKSISIGARTAASSSRLSWPMPCSAEIDPP